MHVLKFQENYNKFVDQNSDLIEEIKTKEELHQQVEDLHDILYEMIEIKSNHFLNIIYNINLGEMIATKKENILCYQDTLRMKLNF